ncbi:MAG: DUF3024 domain-containing protein [Gammaproteobacteria bacterium]
MAFTDIDLQKIKNQVGRLCLKRTPEHLKDELRIEYEIEKQNVIIYEIRPVWNNPSEFIKLPLAKLSYISSQKVWKLYWKRASGKWNKYEPKEFDKDLGRLVQEIDKDTYGCFFG